MPAIWSLVLVIYNLLLMVIGGLVVAISIGNDKPMTYLNMAFATPQNRIIAGTAGVIVIVIGLILLLMNLKGQPASNAVEIENNLLGEVSITIAAIKVIIMKAVRQVNGVKDIKPLIAQSEAGLVVKLHMMINPECSVPELCKSVQTQVKEYLEDIGGLQIAEIKVLVDDLSTVGK